MTTGTSANSHLRIRPGLLPERAIYANVNGEEHICIPVRDFGEWLENAVDTALCDEIDRNPDGSRIPMDKLMREGTPFDDVMTEIGCDDLI